jgi:hypothetical protein
LIARAENQEGLGEGNGSMQHTELSPRRYESEFSWLGAAKSDG